MHWLHLRWPAGLVPSLPVIQDSGETNVEGVWIVGDLTGIPLLKTAADSGSKAVISIHKKIKNQTNKANYKDKDKEPEDSSEYTKNRNIKSEDLILDLVIIGGGISGISAGLKAQELNLNFKIIEADRNFATILDFPKGKPIFLYPQDFIPDTKLKMTGAVKEALVSELLESSKVLVNSNRIIHDKAYKFEKSKNGYFFIVNEEEQEIAKANHIVVAIGNSGNYRKLNIPGEDLDKVFNRLHDPAVYSDKKVLVVGGGDTALETAVAISESSGKVTLVHRGQDFAKAKSENIEKINVLIESGEITAYLDSAVQEIKPDSVRIVQNKSKEILIKNDIVFTQIGRKAPLDFFRRSKIAIMGEWNYGKILTLVGFLAFCIGLYHWKMDGSWISNFFKGNHLFPFGFESWAKHFSKENGMTWVLAMNLVSPSFYYSFMYTALVGVFGIRRVIKRPTPYIKLQTISLFFFQALPLFFLPYFLFPWLGSIGVFESGFGAWFADEFFPKVDYGLGREYWRAFGFVLAWPLFIWNVFSGSPMWGWLVISLIQTFVIIPIIVWRWGKGAYCGWICSCGALAETLGDDHRKKMPHGPFWNRLNFLGQGILAIVMILLLLRILSWFVPGVVGYYANYVFSFILFGWFPLNYYYVVDVWIAGILGVGLYFHFSGRTWCRFGCPLAALMHIYSRFSQFRIFSDKKKCISCNVCTSVCHQGIDIMNFANKGIPMEDPQCVRCSACVVNCPTQVLSFGRLDSAEGIVFDRLKSIL
ncbi:NAD(P)-binding domain-containing protein [Leptospira sp. GIMC2001]|uniref:NAD(P)-binding domain-containing protein n=1 Tax=Leptospira sp. GIMC2001 TaxID=1513297 RepID=UPI00234AE0A8|nr:NAD(P)-binding domain-containing protein [Leptospira sp. GIMC2001]WCL50130.1 NAD(P)-binding domain-containing protein [Leptospira sp. GIMC2001]